MFYSLKSVLALSISLSIAATTSLVAAAAPPVARAPSLVQGPINPNGNTAKCIDVRGALFANGTAVQIFDCNGSTAQQWLISRGATKVQLAGTNFCLDAGSTPGDGVPMKIWTCFDGLPAQAWTYTADNRIALTGQGLCLDLTNGILDNSNPLQTHTCTDNDISQIWTTPI